MENMEIIAVIICISVAGIYGIHKIFEWYNPYIDEEVHIDYITNQDKDRIGMLCRYKRTWKNGKVEFITKQVNV